MSVVLHTSEGDLLLHLYFKECPRAAFNFLALCAAGYYNGCRFLRHIPNVLLQTGDPTNTGKGGDSIFGQPQQLGTSSERFFKDEGLASTCHCHRGVLAMAHKGSEPNTNASQFFILCDAQPAFDGHLTAFGEIDLSIAVRQFVCTKNLSQDPTDRCGEAVLNALEMSCTDLDERQLVLNESVQIIDADVVYNPFAEGNMSLPA